MTTDKWIQSAVKKPSRVTEYLKHKYGKVAFTKDGKIKLSYIYKALKETNDSSLQAALRLAIRFKKKI